MSSFSSIFFWVSLYMILTGLYILRKSKISWIFRFFFQDLLKQLRSFLMFTFPRADTIYIYFVLFGVVTSCNNPLVQFSQICFYNFLQSCGLDRSKREKVRFGLVYLGQLSGMLFFYDLTWKRIKMILR